VEPVDREAEPPDDRVASILAYHEATKHSPESVRRRARLLDWDNKPDLIKRYADLERVPLPEPGRAWSMPALEAITTALAFEGSRPPDLAALARLLVVGSGIHHVERVPGGDAIGFRNYASAGALYPVEIYLACMELGGLPAGVYHFDPADRALTRLRQGDHRASLVRAAAEPAVARAPAVLVLSGIPWRTAWKYAERGYRHLFWDAGMILANLLALASAGALPARVVLGFADTEVSALLGLDERREFPICLVPVGVGDEVPPAGGPPPPVSHREAALSPTEYVFHGIARANDAGRLGSPEDVAAWRRADAPSRPAAARVPDPVVTDTLDEVIRRRGSARVFGRGAIPSGVLRDVLARATAPIPTDHAAADVEPFVIANAVEGLEPGAYAFRDTELRLLRAGSFRREAGFLCLEQDLGATAAATHFVMVDLDRVLDRLGARGYRAAQLEAGIVAGRIYLGAYAHRFGATGLTFYDDEVSRFFGLAQRMSCMLVVAVGESPRLKR
jgi:SagB-type dehydrogenase family enzyme